MRSLLIRFFGCALGVSIALSSASRASIDVDLATNTDCLAIDGETIFDHLGERAVRCDVNGDGWADLVVASPRADGLAGSRNSAGEVSVILGRGGAWSGVTTVATLRTIRMIGPDTLDDLGLSLACADLEKDGFDDVIVAAHNADGPSNSRQNAGEIHIIPGSPSLPALIDLGTFPHKVIFGAISLERMGEELAIADINADGWLDIVASAPGGANFNNTIQSGRVYGFFGRSSWPPTVDALTETSFLIYGATDDGLGVHLVAGDLNGDETPDLVVTARLADGPSNSRSNCGEVNIFRGKTSWPSQLDMNLQSPDTVIYGVDANDQAGSVRGLAIGNYDGLPGNELAIGADLADGKLNDATLTGEVRRVHFSSVFPASLDLRTASDLVIYGQGIRVQFGGWLKTGDVDGDGQTDLIASTRYSDGLSGNRSDAGECSVIRGGSTWPLESTMPSPAFVRILGAQLDDSLLTPGTADLNGDGLDEMLTVAGGDVPTRISRLWLCSPFDADNDGFQQLTDNCPLVFNPSQLDSDGNRLGDACEGDYDGDGLSDPSDCAPRSSAGGTPAEVSALGWSAKTVMHWSASTFSDTYDILRGGLPGSGPTQLGDCVNALDSDLSDTTLTDLQLPIPGASFTYLARGKNRLCALSGSWGTDSLGVERQNSSPNDCP